MDKPIQLGSVESTDVLLALLDNSPPILIEVRFPRSGTSPDWYLCEDLEQVTQITNKIGEGVELHVSSVWDLRNDRGALILVK